MQVKRFAEGFFFNELRKQEMIMCFDPRSVVLYFLLLLGQSASLSLSVCLSVSSCTLFIFVSSFRK